MNKSWDIFIWPDLRKVDKKKTVILFTVFQLIIWNQETVKVKPFMSISYCDCRLHREVRYTLPASFVAFCYVHVPLTQKRSHLVNIWLFYRLSSFSELYMHTLFEHGFVYNFPEICRSDQTERSLRQGWRSPFWLATTTKSTACSFPSETVDCHQICSGVTLWEDIARNHC